MEDIKWLMLLAAKNGDTDPLRDYIIECKIRKKYTASQELGILRKRDEKPQKFAEYNAYVDSCIAEADQEIERILADG